MQDPEGPSARRCYCDGQPRGAATRMQPSVEQNLNELQHAVSALQARLRGHEARVADLLEQQAGVAEQATSPCAALSADSAYHSLRRPLDEHARGCDGRLRSLEEEMCTILRRVDLLEDQQYEGRAARLPTQSCSAVPAARPASSMAEVDSLIAAQRSTDAQMAELETALAGRCEAMARDMREFEAEAIVAADRSAGLAADRHARNTEATMAAQQGRFLRAVRSCEADALTMSRELASQGSQLLEWSTTWRQQLGAHSENMTEAVAQMHSDFAGMEVRLQQESSETAREIVNSELATAFDDAHGHFHAQLQQTKDAAADDAADLHRALTAYVKDLRGEVRDHVCGVRADLTGIVGEFRGPLEHRLSRLEEQATRIQTSAVSTLREQLDGLSSKVALASEAAADEARIRKSFINAVNHRFDCSLQCLHTLYSKVGLSPAGALSALQQSVRGDNAALAAPPTASSAGCARGGGGSGHRGRSPSVFEDMGDTVSLTPRAQGRLWHSSPRKPTRSPSRSRSGDDGPGPPGGPGAWCGSSKTIPPHGGATSLGRASGASPRFGRSEPHGSPQAFSRPVAEFSIIE